MTQITSSPARKASIFEEGLIFAAHRVEDNVGVEHIAECQHADGPATLQFLLDGRLSSSTTYNRLVGSYEADGERLMISAPGATMMACPKALMEQERVWLNLLPTVESFRVDGSGALILTAAEGNTITARR